jgi:predicted alpha/beta superfamily hydrolase
MKTPHAHMIVTAFAMLAAVAGCSRQADVAAADPVPEHDTFTVVSQAVGEDRVINVWLPPGYAESDAAYPVLYMPDGGVGEDFPHIANTVAALVAEGAVAPVLVVGIENTVRRRDLTGPSSVEADAELAPVTDGATPFRAFIADELFPEIARRYRVDGRRAIVGESAAGLFVVETFFLAPGMFEAYIAMDPSIYWNDHDLVRRAAERLHAMPASPVKLWFTAADTEMIYPHCDRLAAILAADAPANLTWTYEQRPEEHHSTIFRATKVEAFRWALWPAAGNAGH